MVWISKVDCLYCKRQGQKSGRRLISDIGENGDNVYLQRLFDRAPHFALGINKIMKDQYFGDINDYKKYGLLRAINNASNLKQLVAWMLTPPDDRTDGGFIEYLSDPLRWERYDQPLYEELVRLVSADRKVAVIESSDILGGCKFFSEVVPDSASKRQEWFTNLLAVADTVDMVFLDPDNGIEIKSKPYGHKYSSKFLYWREIRSLWNSGKSLLIYQHFIREKRDSYIQRMLKMLKNETKDSSVQAFATPRVLFLMALQQHHQAHHEAIAATVNASWNGQIAHWELNGSYKCSASAR